MSDDPIRRGELDVIDVNVHRVADVLGVEIEELRRRKGRVERTLAEVLNCLGRLVRPKA